MKLKIISILAFIMLFVALFFAYDYYKIIHLKPNGTHTWRQMDGASMALTYYQHHRPFLKPQIHNLFNGDGQTIGELPITYYTASKLYTLFGYKDVWFRLLQLVIYFIGTFALYKTALLLFENVFYSLVLTVIALASPVVNFYALNFMPDVPALSSMYVAIYFFVKYVKTHKNSSFYLSLFMAILAGLLKITALIPLCVLFGVFFINQVLSKKKWSFFSKNKLKTLIITLIPFLCFALWLMYSHYYQSLHNNHYFSLDWDPIWIESAATNKYIWQRLTQDWGWFPEFYWKVTFYIALALFVFLLASKKVSGLFKNALVLYLLGIVSFTILYFSALKDHDYYTINLMPFFVFIYFVAIYTFKDAAFMKNKFWMLVVGVFCFFNVQHNDKRMFYRYEGVHSILSEPFYDITESYLQSLGVEKEDKILYDGENSFCSAFYLLNRYGWSNTYNPFSTMEDIEHYKNKGAKYLFVSGNENAAKPLYKNLELIDVFQQTVYIYKL